MFATYYNCVIMVVVGKEILIPHIQRRDIMETTEKKINIHKEPLFSFKTTVSVKEVEGLNNHVYETLRSKVEDLKRKGYDTWELEAEVFKLDSARREISSSIMRIANLINGVEPKEEEESHTNTIKFRAWHKEHKAMAKVVSLKLQGLKHIVWLEFLDEGLNHGETIACELDNVILMQPTGVKDLSDKEVYKGDVVWVTSNLENNYSYLVGTVEMIDGCWTVVGENGASVPLYSSNISISVRGNKYEAQRRWK